MESPAKTFLKWQRGEFVKHGEVRGAERLRGAWEGGDPQVCSGRREHLEGCWASARRGVSRKGCPGASAPERTPRAADSK